MPSRTSVKISYQQSTLLYLVSIPTLFGNHILNNYVKSKIYIFQEWIYSKHLTTETSI